MGLPTAEPAPSKKGHGRWFKIRVVITIIFLLVGFTLYLNWRNGLPPTVMSEMGSGTTFLDLPLMIVYSPSIAGTNVTASANVSFGATSSSASKVSFTWGEVSGTSLPVRFVFLPNTTASPGGIPTGSLVSGPTNGFACLLEMQPTAPNVRVSGGFGVEGPGQQGAWSEVVRMDYSVREMTTHNWFTDDHWLEVDYSLTSVLITFGNLPAANVTAPQAGDLVPVGPAQLTGIQAGTTIGFSWSLRNLVLPVTTFQHRVGNVSLPFLGGGNLTAVLTSMFQWGPDDDYQIHLTVTGPAQLNAQPYVDARFGSLLVE